MGRKHCQGEVCAACRRAVRLAVASVQLVQDLLSLATFGVLLEPLFYLSVLQNWVGRLIVSKVVSSLHASDPRRSYKLIG